MPSDGKKFWETKPLQQLSRREWESLCDQCGKCCLHRFEAQEGGEIQFTTVCCRYLDRTNGGCNDYANRLKNQPECVSLTPGMLRDPSWLPQSCAYRLVAEKRELPDWHPLVSGDPGSVGQAGQFIGRFATSELEADEPSHYLVDWIR